LVDFVFLSFSLFGGSFFFAFAPPASPPHTPRPLVGGDNLRYQVGTVYLTATVLGPVSGRGFGVNMFTRHINPVVLLFRTPVPGTKGANHQKPPTPPPPKPLLRGFCCPCRCLPRHSTLNGKPFGGGWPKGKPKKTNFFGIGALTTQVVKNPVPPLLGFVPSQVFPCCCWFENPGLFFFFGVFFTQFWLFLSPLLTLSVSGVWLEPTHVVFRGT